MADLRQFLDFETNDARGLVAETYRLSNNALSARRNDWKQSYSLFHGFIPEADRNPDMANVFIPKMLSIVRSKAPRDVKAFLGKRPYIPFTVQDRDEWEESVKVTEALVDDQLHKAFYSPKIMLAALIKTVTGTVFVEHTPFHEVIQKSELTTDPATGQVVKQQSDAVALRSKIKVYNPSDIMPDPHATGLEEIGSCRWLIKRDLVSRNDVIRGWQKGLYPDMDIELFMSLANNRNARSASDISSQMLSEIGHFIPVVDNDMSFILRYETPDRYIDMFVETLTDTVEVFGTVLRDTDNPYAHKNINLSRWIHDQDAHTRNQFWGIGEVRENAAQQLMLNDLYNMAIDAHMLLNQPTIYHDSDINKNALVRMPGNTVKVKMKDGKDIRSQIFESGGTGLPRDHYAMMDRTERNMDLAAGQFAVSRGESEEGAQTASEILTLRSEANVRHEMNVKLGEDMFLADFGTKVISTIAQVATADDIIDVVGQERATRAVLVSPNDLPGAFNFQFKGSDRIADQLVKQRNFKELAPILLQIPNVLPGWVATQLLELHDISKKDIEEGVIPDELMLQIEVASAQFETLQAQEIAQAGLQGQGLNTGQRSGRTAPNTQQRLLQQQGSQQVAANVGR